MPLTSWWNSSQRHVFPFLFSNLIQEQVQSGFSLKTHIRAQSKSQSHLPVKSILYSEFFQGNTELTFLLVTCLQPSIGAGAVWIGIPLRGWVQISAMKNGDHLKVPLPLSHFTRALDKLEECKTEESLNTEEKVERKFASLSRRRQRFFQTFFIFVMSCNFYVIFTSDNIGLVPTLKNIPVSLNLF